MFSIQHFLTTSCVPLSRDVILADEPTGALDSKTGNEIMRVFSELNNMGKTVILITHDKNVASYAKRLITIQDGRILSDEEI